MAGVAGVGPMRVVSWNVNGIRACVRHGLVDFLGRSGADIVGVQEVRALPEEIPPAARTPPAPVPAHTVTASRAARAPAPTRGTTEPRHYAGPDIAAMGTVEVIAGAGHIARSATTAAK